MRWIILFFVIASIILGIVIYLDQKPQQVSEPEKQTFFTPDTSYHHTPILEPVAPSAPINPNSFEAFHTGVDLSDMMAIQNRILEIEERLIDIGHNREAIPFYGELTLLYMQLGREDGAAEAVRHTAMLLNDADDWWNSAVLFYRWALKQQERDQFFYYLSRSESSFEEASKLTDNPDMLTDFAIVLQANSKNEEAQKQLKRAMSAETANFRPFLYYGLILNESGKKDESILYIHKSMEKAISEDEVSLIRNVLAQSSIEI